MSEVKVNSIKGVGASVAAISIDNTDGSCVANITNKPNRNLIINGAMQVAQRGTSSTASGFATLDRFLVLHSGTDEAPTQEQADVAAGTTPYTLGFRKSLKITNGDQTNGAGATDYILINYKTESQDIAKSGWNYTDPNSFITFSFWVKSSVAQNFYVRTINDDNPKQRYAFETGSLTANTWTKVTKSIPGNSNLVFNNDNGIGLYFRFYLFRGTNHTSNSVNLNQWETHNSSQNVPDVTSTWYQTDNATFELTGVQLEVGSVATDFEHKSYAEELTLCHRYYYKLQPAGGAYFGSGFWYNSNSFICHIDFPVIMRANVTALEQSGTASHYKVINNATTSTCSSVPTFLGDPNPTSQSVNFVFNGSGTQGQGGLGRSGNASAFLGFSAEL